MHDQSEQDERGTVRLNMQELYREAVELAGQERADQLWQENQLDSAEQWPGKWAKAVEVVERLRGRARG